MIRRPFFGVVQNEDQLVTVMRGLLEAEFFMQDISAMVLETGRQGHDPAAPDGVLGRAFGLFEETETIFLPGFGALAAGGHLPAFFLKADPGAAEKGFVSILATWGVPEEEASWIEERMLEGHVVIAVNAEGEEEWERARKAFSKSGGLIEPSKQAA